MCVSVSMCMHVECLDDLSMGLCVWGGVLEGGEQRCHPVLVSAMHQTLSVLLGLSGPVLACAAAGS